jgi:hypothetical protein
LGRWLNADPIGMKGGLNLLEYARANPLNLVDSNGTDPQTEGQKLQSEGCKPPKPIQRTTGEVRIDFIKENGGANRFGFLPPSKESTFSIGNKEYTTTISGSRIARIQLSVGGKEKTFTAPINSESSFTIDNIPTSGALTINRIEVFTSKRITETVTNKSTGEIDFIRDDVSYAEGEGYVEIPGRAINAYRGRSFLLTLSSSTYAPENGSTTTSTALGESQAHTDPAYTFGKSAEITSGVKGGIGVESKFESKFGSTNSVSYAGDQRQINDVETVQTTIPGPGPERWAWIYGANSQPIAQRYVPVRAHAGWQ